VKKGPKENRFRPSIDALFRSAAYSYGSRVIGIILSGLLSDGTSGLWSVKRLGGVAIVQNPSEALFASMPENVLQHVDVDHIVSIQHLPKLLEELIREPAKQESLLNEQEEVLMKTELMIASQHNAFEMGIMKMGKLSPFTCPECHGALVSIKEGNNIRFRCHTGHAFSSSALLDELAKAVEESCWNTLRGMEETIMLLESKGKELETSGDRNSAREFYKKAQQIREQSHQVRKIVFEQKGLKEEKVEE